MTTEHAIERLNQAIETVNRALGQPIMDGAMTFWGNPYGQLAVWCANSVFFVVSVEEIQHNTHQCLVNLVKSRLVDVLSDLTRKVQRLGTYCCILHGTQPWVLVQGL